MPAKDDTDPCFYCRELPEAGGKGSLAEAETRHASAARRIRVGDTIGLIDGQGGSARAVVETVSRTTLAFTVSERHGARPPALGVYVVTAVPKGERFRTVIDMLSQIGVAGILPLICERSAVKPRRSSVDRWRRVAMEACKQSRNPRFPGMHDPQSIRDVLTCVADDDVLLFADPHGGAIHGSPASKGAVYLFIGPEGGFTDTETGILRDSGAHAVSLGANVLRIETAAVVGAALIAINSVHGVHS